MAHARVLLIDDDPWMVEQFAVTLNRAGYEAQIASNGIDGMAEIDRWHPDVVVLDIFMPGPNGIVLLHEMQSHSDLSRIPVIICTNSATDIPKDTIAHYGVRMVIDKTTMEPNDIVAAVRKVLM